MAGVNYGSRFDLPKLSAEEVGILIIIEQVSKHGLGWLNWLLIGLEVALSFVPGLEEVGLALIETGFAIGQTVLDTVEAGKFEATSLLNFVGLPLQGGTKIAANIAKNAREAKIIEKFVEQEIETYTNLISKASSSTERQSLENEVKALYEAQSTYQQTGRRAIFDQKKVDNFAKNLAEKRVSFLRKYKPEINADALKTFERQSTQRIKNSIGEIFKNEQAEKLVAKASKSRKLDKTLIFESRTSKMLGLNQREIRTLQNLARKGKANTHAWFAVLERSAKRSGNEYLSHLFAISKNDLIKIANRSEALTLKKIEQKFSKALSLAKTTLSPHRIAKKAVDKAFEPIEKQVEKLRERFVELKKSLNIEKNFEDEFIRSGGNVIASRFILGYKMIAEEAQFITIMISFRPEATSSKTGKNVGGKAPVIKTLSILELKDWLSSTSKGRYYLENWATSMGGYSFDTSTIMGLANIADVLSFLPTRQVKTLLSAVSVAKGFAKGDVFNQKWFSKLGDSFKQEITEAPIETAAKILPNKQLAHVTGRALKTLPMEHKVDFEKHVKGFAKTKIRQQYKRSDYSKGMRSSKKVSKTGMRLASLAKL